MSSETAQCSRLFDLQGFSGALQELLIENYELRREVGMSSLDEDPRDLESPVDQRLEPGLTTDESVIARQLEVVETARKEWKTPVLEPPGANWERIGSLYIRGDLGLDWSWVKYERNGDLAWCGAFAAYCYGTAGLRHEIRYRHMASCSRLCAWSKDNERRIDWRGTGDIRAGDIVIVGKPSYKRTGQHITICERFDPAAGLVYTIEGNAHGRLPSGAWKEGVITRERPLPGDALSDDVMRVMHVIRPLPEDFVARDG